MDVDKKKITELGNSIDEITDSLNSSFGIIILKNNQLLYEKYSGVNKNSRFRIFSCSKLITAMAIILLVQQNKLKLNDTINKFGINIPNNNAITILHLLNHTSGIYDVYLELYANLNLMSNLKINSNMCELIEFKDTIDIINKHKPNFYPTKNPSVTGLKYYNNTGYDILGYIIFVASGIQPGYFIKKNIFTPLKMNHSGFHLDNHKDECFSYENNKKIGIAVQQNWYCGNAFISCSLSDYAKFLNGYKILLNKNTLNIYHKLYFFKKTTTNNTTYTRLGHQGGGDFSHDHITKKEKYNPLTRTIVQHYIGNKKTITIIMSENYKNTNGFYSNEYKNWRKLYDALNFLF